MNSHIDGIREAQQNIRRKRIRNIVLISLILPILSGVILLIINLLFFSNDKVNNSSNNKIEISNDH